MKPLIVANWKMNPLTLRAAGRIFTSLKKELKNIRGTEVVICPPFVYLPLLIKSPWPKNHGRFSFGSQNCFWEPRGAFTGEISPLMLKNLGCQYVILGHSERRIYFGESDEAINKKIKAAVKAKLNPILCVGETKKEKKARETLKVIRRQLKKAFFGISVDNFSSLRLVIAYEPVWAIGGKSPCDLKTATEIRLFIKKVTGEIFKPGVYELLRARRGGVSLRASSFAAPPPTAERRGIPPQNKNLIVIYGGSVSPKDSRGFIKKAGFGGLLVGGASLNPKAFAAIVKSVS